MKPQYIQMCRHSLVMAAMMLLISPNSMADTLSVETAQRLPRELTPLGSATTVNGNVTIIICPSKKYACIDFSFGITHSQDNNPPSQPPSPPPGGGGSGGGSGGGGSGGGGGGGGKGKCESGKGCLYVPNTAQAGLSSYSFAISGTNSTFLPQRLTGRLTLMRNGTTVETVECIVNFDGHVARFENGIALDGWLAQKTSSGEGYLLNVEVKALTADLQLGSTATPVSATATAYQDTSAVATASRSILFRRDGQGNVQVP